MDFKIEKHIPAPPKPLRDGIAFPFEKLKVGESICIPKSGRKSWAFVFKAMERAKVKLNIQLTTRLVDENNRRVWRVE